MISACGNERAASAAKRIIRTAPRAKFGAMKHGIRCSRASASSSASAASPRPVVPITQGTAVSGKLINNQLFDYNGDGVDVTPGPVPGWPVRTGWDMTTGFGTPKAPGFVAAVRAARNATP